MIISEQIYFDLFHFTLIYKERIENWNFWKLLVYYVYWSFQQTFAALCKTKSSCLNIKQSHPSNTSLNKDVQNSPLNIA